MAQLSFRYSMSIDFDSPVSNHCFSLRCFPQSDERQQIEEMDITIDPSEDSWQAVDGFGNLYISGSVRRQHRSFCVCVSGKASTGMNDSVPSVNELRENIYKYNTRLTAPSGAVLDALEKLTGKLAKDAAGNELVMADLVMDYLNEYMNYVPGATFVDTKASEAFEKGQGVCQDYAHIMLSMLRARGICSRYVVGLMEGEGFSHAWVEVRHEGRWYGFDPTNHSRVTDRYIKMSHGRDYSDCMINIGCMRGYSMQTTTVYASLKVI